MARGGNASGRDRAAVTMVAAAVLLLTGCNADPTPVVTETPSVSPTPVVSLTPSATPTPIVTTDPLLDVLPEGATAPGLAGAIITAQFFLEEYGPMIRTGDTSVWDALSMDECKYCADASATAASLADEQKEVVGGDVTVDPNRTRGSAEGNELSDAILAMLIRQDAYTVHAPGDAKPTQSDAQEVGVVVGLDYIDGHWLVKGVNVVEPNELPR